MCVCVCVWDRESEKVSVCTRVYEREKERDTVCVIQGKRRPHAFTNWRSERRNIMKEETY